LRFDWAKEILESKASKMIITETSSDTNITFSIPSKCPTSLPIDYSFSNLDEHQTRDVFQLGTPENKRIQ
jgi:hypothetical protein